MTDTNADDWVSSTHEPMGFPEFVVVIASIMALNPLAMDMMLPALPNIASTFHIPTPNRLQEVLSTFLIGFGVGQFVMGPLSDRFGRRPVLLGGMVALLHRQRARDRGAVVRDACCWRACCRDSAPRPPA